MTELRDAMRVHAHGEPAVLTLDQVPRQAPGPGEVAIRVQAAGVNFPDLLVVAGTYQVLPPCPFIPGKEVAGTVTSVGPGVADLVPGDRVMAQLEHGGYATGVVAPASATWRIPDGMTFEHAAAMGLVYQTAWFALIERGGFTPGQTVLVTGAAGGVGLAAVQLVHAMGGTAIAGLRGDAQAEALRANGASHVVDLSGPDPRNTIREQVHGLTGGRGVNLVIEQVGAAVFEGAIRSLAWCGHLVVVGFAGGGIPMIKANYLLLKNITVSGLQWSDYRDRVPEQVADAQKAMFDLYAANKLKPVIQQCFELEQAALALAAVQKGGNLGKVVLTTQHHE